MEIIKDLKKRSSELTDLHHIMALLQWDQEVQIPTNAAQDRAGQLATLSTIIHRKEVSIELGDLLLEAEKQIAHLSETDRALIRVMRRSYDQSTKLPEQFVADFSRLTSQALNVWVEARKRSDFKMFSPLLEKIVSMCREQAEYLGYTNEPYDALLDLYEEGLTTTQVASLFEEIKDPLTEMVHRAKQMPQQEINISKDLERRRQTEFAEQALQKIGFDFTRGRQDVSAHPFTTTMGHNDRRVTNRYNPRSLEFIFSALHEGGHALYEQGISSDLNHTALDNGVSLGIHESQSRLWENIIGRSLPFWQNLYPNLKEHFPGLFDNLSIEEFVKGINVIKPGLIRVEADEVSYNLHVLIRFEIEKGLMEGSLPVKDLPVVWNQKYKEYLDVEVDSDANGVLQDIHWAHGSLGYFPTYTIGNMAAAQFWHKFTQLHQDYEAIIAGGTLEKIRTWLTENIYRHGSVYQPAELLQKVTGEGLNPQYFLDYLRQKFRLPDPMT